VVPVVQQVDSFHKLMLTMTAPSIGVNFQISSLAQLAELDK
jgi:hypothetical protein